MHLAPEWNTLKTKIDVSPDDPLNVLSVTLLWRFRSFQPHLMAFLSRWSNHLTYILVTWLLGGDGNLCSRVVCGVECEWLLVPMTLSFLWQPRNCISEEKPERGGNLWKYKMNESCVCETGHLLLNVIASILLWLLMNIFKLREHCVDSNKGKYWNPTVKFSDKS